MYFSICALKSKLTLLTEIASRDFVKVSFFGRTSSGKSSVINALLGEPVLPTGLGHTTACFVEIRGTVNDTPCLLLPMPDGEFEMVETR